MKNTIMPLTNPLATTEVFRSLMPSKVLTSVILCFLVGVSASCDSDDEGDDPKSSEQQIVTLGGDYEGAGILSVVSLPSMEVQVNAVAGLVGGDPAVRAFGDYLYILDRFGGDSLTVVDRSLELVGQVTTGAGTNPQDLAVVGDEIIVAAYDSADLLILSQSDLNAGVVARVDLSSLDADDGLPDCNSVASAGNGTVFVSCQLLDRATFTPRGPGKVAVVDVASRSIRKVIDLEYSNPFSWLKPMPSGDLVFSTAPGAIFGATNDGGCLETISVASEDVNRPCISVNSELMAHPSEISLYGSEMHFVNVKGFDSAEIRSVNGGEVAVASFAGVGGNPSGITRCPNGEIVVADASAESRGLWVFDKDGQALHSDVLEVGWPQTFLPINTTLCW